MINIENKLSGRKLCEFLKTVDEVNKSTLFLKDNGYMSHALPCKDWDIARIVPEIGNGNFLDMGSCESYILTNVMLRETSGEKFGIDLRMPTVNVPGVEYLVGDLMSVPITNGYFRYITCLSVIEHQVNLSLFAREASRLLEVGGKLFVTFDYWHPGIKPSIQLYGLAWQPLDRPLVEYFITECNRVGLFLVENVDWTIQDQVIREGYYSPEVGIRYTFGILTFEKK
jgi:SAM-dependent methyltransferase